MSPSRFSPAIQRALLTCVVLMASACIGLLGTPVKGWGYAEDYNHGEYSSFHYVLTRALAHGAGFSQSDAELIAVVSQATDLGSFTGDTGVTVTISGTERGHFERGQYWHYARRASTPTIDGATYPGGQDTCEYFNGTFQACSRGAGPELSAIETWAYSGGAGGLTQAMAVPAVTITSNGVTIAIDWTSNSRAQHLVALGIYLHALADSYSHQDCMAVAHQRMHTPSPAECSVLHWHGDLEFGPKTSNEGTPFSMQGGNAVWGMLLAFSARIGADRSPRLSTVDAQVFVESFVTTDDPTDRNALANAEYLLQQDGR